MSHMTEPQKARTIVTYGSGSDDTSRGIDMKRNYIIQHTTNNRLSIQYNNDRKS
jgi:hypothetical protein